MADTERIPRPPVDTDAPTEHADLTPPPPSGGAERETLFGAEEELAKLSSYLSGVERSGITTVLDEAMKDKARRMESVVVRIAELDAIEQPTDEEVAELGKLQWEAHELGEDLDSLREDRVKNVAKKEQSEIMRLREELEQSDTGPLPTRSRGGDTEPAPRPQPEKKKGGWLQRFFGGST